MKCSIKSTFRLKQPNDFTPEFLHWAAEKKKSRNTKKSWGPEDCNLTELDLTNVVWTGGTRSNRTWLWLHDYRCTWGEVQQWMNSVELWVAAAVSYRCSVIYLLALAFKRQQLSGVIKLEKQQHLQLLLAQNRKWTSGKVCVPGAWLWIKVFYFTRGIKTDRKYKMWPDITHPFKELIWSKVIWRHRAVINNHTQSQD